MTADGSKKIAFVDSKYNQSTINNYFTMQVTTNNYGGWSQSHIRTVIMPQFKAAMSSEWREIISLCTKYSDNTGGGSNVASYVTSTTDDIFLIAEYELTGNSSWANSAEKNYQMQYDYYKNGNGKILYKHNNPSTACNWWLRSVYAGNNETFCRVIENGTVNSYYTNYSFGFAPAFMVGGNAA